MRMCNGDCGRSEDPSTVSSTPALNHRPVGVDEFEPDVVYRIDVQVPHWITSLMVFIAGTLVGRLL